MNREEAKTMIACLIWATQKARSNALESIMNVGGLERNEAEGVIGLTSKWLGKYYEKNLAALMQIQERLESGAIVRCNELNNLLIIAQQLEPTIDFCAIFWRDGYDLPRAGIELAIGNVTD